MQEAERSSRVPLEEYLVEVVKNNVLVLPCEQPPSKPTVITQLEFNERPLELNGECLIWWVLWWWVFNGGCLKVGV